MTLLLFLTALLLELVYILLFILTIQRPPFRFSPPPSACSWQFFAAWLLASLDSAGNVYFVHQYIKDDQMIEADIYVAYKKGE